MKAAFLKSMKFLYPIGVDTRDQHRDLVRTFVMGWNEALMSRGDETGLKEGMPITESIVSPKWYPDSTWKWW